MKVPIEEESKGRPEEPEVDESEINSSDEEDKQEYNQDYEKNVSDVKCEKTENPHEDDDFSVTVNT